MAAKRVSAILAGFSVAILAVWVVALVTKIRLVDEFARSEYDGQVVLTRQRFDQLAALDTAVRWLLPLALLVLLASAALLLRKRFGPSRTRGAERS